MLSFSFTSPPAAALTDNERFVLRLYEDFKGREPTAGELAWISASLDGGTTRSAAASGFFKDSESDLIYARLGYRLVLGREPSSTEASSATTLIDSGGYLTLEVNLFSSAEYYAAAGGTNSAYVGALYEDVLLRAAGASELTYWAGQLDAAAKTRAQVATSVIKSAEGSNRRVGGPSGVADCTASEILSAEAVRAGAYCIVLDRMASSSDLSYWAPVLQGTGNLIDVYIWLAASSEYYRPAV